jgi:hypothetical protein
VLGLWTDAASIGEGAPIASQIADQLRGKEFRNFRKFRESFWRAVAADPILSQQFDQYDLELIKRGISAIVIKSERVGSRSKYELHHKEYIHLGGKIYNIDNINVMTPKRHIETHREHKIEKINSRNDRVRIFGIFDKSLLCRLPLGKSPHCSGFRI